MLVNTSIDEAATDEQKATVLVVEDDVHLLEGIRDILELDGYVVTTAADGLKGLEMLQYSTPPPDLIVSDIMMPQMDGIEFLKTIRKDERWANIPFIFLTAKGEKSDQHRGMKLGVDDYIVKPYDPADLLVKIEARLKRYANLTRTHKTGMSSLKKQILTMLNHEFRTPLTFVVAYSDLLDNHGAQKLSEEEIMQYVQGISAGADRLRNLIENFILLVEIETEDAQQTYTWRKGPIASVDDIFKEARERVKTLETRRHVCTVEIEPNIPVFIGDVEYLTGAVAQYLSNAAKFSEPGSPIAMGARRQDNKVIFWVKDQGRGIKKEEHENIWESFYQIDRVINEDQGAGAGLAIARGIARLHGGSVSVESEPGKGSLFKLWVPVAEAIATID
jgi:signal transduction histidine kinase